MANKNPNTPPQQADTYTHSQQAVQRPDVGVQPEFTERKGAKTYRYDSSLAPELCWDENAERELAEWLLDRIAEAAEQGEQGVFSEPQRWQGSDETFASIAECVARLKSLTRPFLNWTGKAERREIAVPTIPLFVHERHATQAILQTLDSYKAAGTNLDLFGDPELDIADKLDAYEHKGPWTNRMVLGDSLQVMNSLLEYEGLGGQVQMIYMDPPYGVKFGSNFQPFVRKRDVKHGKDDEMIREPEMVKAYRDTWELGLHSYLTYLRDRLLLARELLTESGSIFVQISDENLHHVREVMDEVFSATNFCGIISFQKTGGMVGTLISPTVDYLIWYAKDVSKVKYNQLFTRRLVGDKSLDRYDSLLLPDGSTRRLTRDELSTDAFPEGARRFQLFPLYSEGASNQPQEFLYDGITYTPRPDTHWKTNLDGLDRLAKAKRIEKMGRVIRYRRFADDFPLIPITDRWESTQTGTQRIYVVQTSFTVLNRCLLMATDPGDLVLDPTCGSGTTAYVAEQWGRRWITCDTSRVPLALARQRLLTATFPWYELKEPQRGPAGGFVYQRKQNRKGVEIGGLVPRITLKSIANDEEPETVTLVDKPEQNKKVTRVCGPFSVEATVQAAGSMLEEQDGVKDLAAAYENPRTYLDRMIEVLRQSHTLRLPGNKALELDQVRPLAAEDYEHLHAEAVEQNGATNPERDQDSSRRIAVMFGPQDGAIDSGAVLEAAREAWYSKFDALYFFGFAIQAKARELVENHGKLKLPCTYVAVTPDVVMSDLLKTSKTSEIFSITGLPDVDFKPSGEQAPDGRPLYQVELLGLDIFRPHDLETESIHAENLPCWMLDTDYNGMVFMARQVFFPKTSAWDNLQKSLKARFDASVWDHLAGTSSEPFVLGTHRRVAIKVIDERGNELMVVREVEGT